MRTICGTFLAATVALAAVGAEGGARVELPLDGCGERLFTQASMLV